MKKEERWVFHEDVDAQAAGGFVRRVLAYNKELMCVENAFQKGGAAPLHSHPHLQIAYITEGKFTVEVDGETKVMSKGDSVLVPGNVAHSVTCLEDGIVLDIFTPMREDFV